MSGANWWLNSFPASMPGGTTVGGGGGYGTDAISYRDGLDAKRAAAGFAPGASYPDGYLGNITDRREDKMLAVLQTRLTQHSYQRGVHKGEKIGQDAYFWNQDMNPDMGLERQAATAAPVDVEGGIVFMTQRYAPTGDPVERLAHDGKLAGADPRTVDKAAQGLSIDPAKNQVQVVSPSRRAQMSRHLPRWSGVFQA